MDVVGARARKKVGGAMRTEEELFVRRERTARLVGVDILGAGW